MFNNNKGKQRLAIMQLVGDGLLVCGLVLVLSFPHLLELSGVQDVIMRLMGILFWHVVLQLITWQKNQIRAYCVRIYGKIDQNTNSS